MTMTPQQVLDETADPEYVSEELVAAFLFAVSQVADQQSVRKTTLAALFDAAEESPQAGDDLLDVLARANLNRALLGMRERGVVYLTDDGFALTEATKPPSVWDSTEEWLTGLVRRKWQEWEVFSAAE